MPKASSNTPNSDLSELGYEQARDELVSVVARLEAGSQTLEESLALWERGEALAARCQEWLDGARERLGAVRAQGVAPASSTRGDGAAGDDSAGSAARGDPLDEDDDIGPDDIEEQA